MPSKSDNNESIFNADTIVFNDSPTLVCGQDDEHTLSEFKLPVELIKESPGSSSPALPKVAPPSHDAANPGLPPRNNLYTISHEVGVGGYGQVWQGTQKNLARKVALKSLKQDQTDKSQFERFDRIFRQEALTTAYIQHPNVVPIYDLSQDEQGRPLVAMKLVEGRQWNKVLAEDFKALAPLEFLEVHLPVLISVTHAVAFAHSKGIIHRDLKPAQVMIGHFSEVLLMDWGLAVATRDSNKDILCDPAIIVDSSSPLIYPILPAGTPGYMAPEQTEKDPVRLGPWTDIYLLGAILYELLTGYKPHSQANNADPLQAARLNQVTKPEVCNPERDIPAQLSRLTMKALSTKPSDRIASASIFVNELKDYLSRAGRRGESMMLVTDVSKSIIDMDHTYENLQTFLDKLDRALAQWPDNHMAEYLRKQVLATFARTALDHRDLKLARFQAERLKGSQESLYLLEEIAEEEIKSKDQSERLERAHSQARSERERAESLLRFLIIDLHQELRSTGRSDIIYKVANEAQEFFDSLEGEEISSNTLYNRCLVYLQIANVLTEYGRRSEAEGALTKAIEMSDILLSISPGSTDWRKLKADCLDKMGLIYYTVGRIDMAKQAILESLKIRKEFQSQSPLPYSRTLQELSRINWREQDYDRAMEQITESITIVRTFLGETPADAVLQGELAAYLFIQANIFRDMGKRPNALKATYESLTLRIGLADQFPGVTSKAEEVYWSRSNLGYLQLISGDLESALENLKHDLAARRSLFEEDVSNAVRSMGITFQLSALAEVTFLMNRPDETERFISECLVHSGRLVKMDGNNPSAVASHAFHLVQWGELLASRDEWDESEKIGRQALERGRYAYWMSPNNNGILRQLIRVLAYAARVANRAGKTDEANSYIDETEALFEAIKSRQSSGELLALKVRLQMDTVDAFEKTMLLKRLKEKRRFDPYLQQWAREYSLTV